VATARRCLQLLLVLAVCTVMAPRDGFATSLTGVAIYAADETGEPVGPFWHTSLDPSGRPIGITRWIPTGVRGITLLNDADGEISVDLVMMSHITTTFWQFNLGEFPQWVVLNLFFNGDNLTPGISALVPFDRGFTLFTTNPNPSTLSLYAREVQNPGALIYDDGSASGRLGAAFYFRSGAPEDAWMWRPSDLTNLDRVGTVSIAPDGQWDAVLVFELVVGPSQQQPTPGPVSNPAGFGFVPPPLAAYVGEDLWATPSKKPLEEGAGAAAGIGAEQSTTPATEGTPSDRTPAASEAPGHEGTPTAAPSNATSLTPTPGPEVEHGTPTPFHSRTPARTATTGTGAMTSPTPRAKGWLW